MLPQRIVLKPIQSRKSPTNLNRNPSPQKRFDFFICIKDQFIPVQRSKLQSCKILKDMQVKDNKIIHIEQDLDIPIFCKVLGYLHGKSLQLCTMKQLSAFLDVVDFLGIQVLILQIQQLILRNIQSFELFELMELAQRFSLQKVFNTCFNYLQLDQFQQIKYNKFGFVQCNFQLFQIILRRHHFLKLRKQIQGLKVSDIEEVIRVYCRRYKYDQTILKRLLDKYVHSVKQSIKQSEQSGGNGLKLLNKLPFKDLLQSSNIELEIKQLNTQEARRNSYRRDSHGYPQGQQIKQDLSNSVYQEDQPAQVSQQKISQEQKIIISKPVQVIKEIKRQIKEKQSQKNIKSDHPNQSQSESFVTKISGLLNEYQQALDNHQVNLQKMKRVAKSQLLENDGQQQNTQNLKLLDYQNLFFTVYLPSK